MVVIRVRGKFEVGATCVGVAPPRVLDPWDGDALYLKESRRSRLCRLHAPKRSNYGNSIDRVYSEDRLLNHMGD